MRRYIHLTVLLLLCLSLPAWSQLSNIATEQHATAGGKNQGGTLTHQYVGGLPTISSSTGGTISHQAGFLHASDLPCATPVSLVAGNVTQNVADLTWAATSAPDYVVRYRVKGASVWIEVNVTAANTTPLSGLFAGMIYEWQVRGLCSPDKAVSSQFTTVMEFTTLGTPACAIPQNVVASNNVNGTAFDVSWDVATGAQNYSYQYRIVGTTTWTTASVAGTTVSLSGLMPLTNYELAVQTLCSADNSLLSEFSTVLTVTTPCELLTWYADSDGDTFGDPLVSQQSCTQPTGYVPDNTDNNDKDAAQNPNATDTAGSGIDANGDGLYTWYKDADGDGFGTTTTVTSTNTTAGTGESANRTDTNDSDATQNPDAIDTPGSGIDANGDGTYTWYQDLDGDGHGSTTTATSANTTASTGESATSDDCDDADKNVYPGAPALADGKDNNCDGTVDKLMLTATVADQTRVYGNTDPAFTITYAGFTGTDDATVLDTAPIATTTATATSDVGTYPITATGGADNAYDFTYTAGTLTITQATATITLADLDQQEDGTAKTPTVTTTPAGLGHTITYDGNATAPTNPGSYAVVVTISDINYTGEATATMTISEVLGLAELLKNGMEVYPNPVRDYLTLTWKDNKARQLSLYDTNGRRVRSTRIQTDNYRLDMRGLSGGLYRLVIGEKDNTISVNVIKGR